MPAYAQRIFCDKGVGENGTVHSNGTSQAPAAVDSVPTLACSMRDASFASHFHLSHSAPPANKAERV